MSSILTPGFADPVSGAQSCFRGVLDAMARPGQVHRIEAVLAPAPLTSAAAALLLTLVDHETPLWLDPDAAPAQDWISFHTGAPPQTLARAMFAMALSLPDLATLPNGTDEMPETAATVILQLPSLTTGRRYILHGPGLRHPVEIRLTGLPENFATIWQANHALFPRGIDLILCAGDQLMALPRSVTVTEP
jgi:alpha-D-ribose 1-methylphosphonate 5-triphosphate synthase subunit PhnH